MQWGLSSPGPDQLLFLLAGAETVEQKGVFRQAFQRGRLALLADGFYEWKRAAADKRPSFFQFTRPLWIAGIGEQYGQSNGCLLTTTVANDVVASLHDRMPV